MGRSWDGRGSGPSMMVHGGPARCQGHHEAGRFFFGQDAIGGEHLNLGGFITGFPDDYWNRSLVKAIGLGGCGHPSCAHPTAVTWDSHR